MHCCFSVFLIALGQMPWSIVGLCILSTAVVHVQLALMIAG